jgi:tripartite-type tricarboxylate transporter receptor subunit TctC
VLLCTPTSAFTAHPYLHDSLPYRPGDLLPIARTSNTVIVIATPASLKVGSLMELFALARAEPGKINWAGVTGALDFLFEGFLKREGLSMIKVRTATPSRPRPISPRAVSKYTAQVFLSCCPTSRLAR